DVRHQLGASYGVEALLVESRLDTHYEISGMIEPAVAADAMQLIRDRMAALRNDPDAAARAFVTARRRVVTQLRSVAGTAGSLASSVEIDAQLGRSPMSDVSAANAVAELTIDGMAATLDDLDLDRAAILMRGSEPEVKRAFEVIGRTPTMLQAPAASTANTAAADDDADDDASERTASNRDDYSVDYLEDALTAQGPRTRLALKVGVGLGTAKLRRANERMRDSRYSGYFVFGDVGYRFSRTMTAGLHLSIGAIDATYTIDNGIVSRPLTGTPIDVAAFIRATGYDRLWGQVMIGAHIDQVTSIDDTVMPNGTKTYAGVGFGIEAGVDLLVLGTHRLCAMLKAGGVLGDGSGYGGVAIGIGYRR
ncbi:MAG: hypothetical protein AB7L28_12545, partial [Kofleriaceae bacterium]